MNQGVEYGLSDYYDPFEAPKPWARWLSRIVTLVVVIGLPLGAWLAYPRSVTPAAIFDAESGTATVHPGEIFAIALDGDRQSGSGWQNEPSIDPAIARPLGFQYDENNPSGAALFLFRAQDAGTAEASFRWHPTPLGGRNPAKYNYQVQVTVQ
jgi:hypothetical protein